MSKVVTIIGGNQESTLKKMGEKFGCKVLFHDGLAKGSAAKRFEKLVKEGDCIVIMLGQCSHPTMELVKELCKKMNKPILFHRTCGASGAMKLVREWYSGRKLIA